MTASWCSRFLYCCGPREAPTANLCQNTGVGGSAASPLIDPGPAADRSLETLPEWVRQEIPRDSLSRVTEATIVSLRGQPEVSETGEALWDCTALRGILAAGRSVRERSTDDETDLRLVFLTRDEDDDRALEAEIEAAQRGRAEAVLH